MRKGHHHCKSPGCEEAAVFIPYGEYPHVGFCEKHAVWLIKRTVESIIDGTHPELQETHKK